MPNSLKICIASLNLLVTIAACNVEPEQAGQEEVISEVNPGLVPNAYATNGTILRGFRVEEPTRALVNVTITGLQSGEELRGLDFRPATGELFAISNQSRLYVLDPVTGAAVQRGVDGAFTITSTDDVGFDFNPVPDRIRVVGNDGQNLRLNPNNGALAATDGTLNGATTSARAAAYTNSFAGLPSPPSTTLYVFSVEASGKPALYVQNPPNDGTTTRVGFVNIGLIGARSVSFDIVAPDTGYLLVTRGAGTGAAELFRVDLTNAAVTSLGFVGTLGQVRGFALVPAARPQATAYVTDGTNLRGITLDNPAFTLTSVPVSGLELGEQIRGLDFRPATGELFAITNFSRLYVIDPATGAAVTRGGDNNLYFIGDRIGFDFNPVVDRIRVVTSGGGNIRLNPNDGSRTAIDRGIRGDAPQATAAAYTNSILGMPAPTSTTLYVASVDINTGGTTLYIQNPPNDGVTTLVGVLDFGSPVSVFRDSLSFDILPPNNEGYVVINRDLSASLYRVDLATAATAFAGTLSGTSEITGLAIIPPGPN